MTFFFQKENQDKFADSPVFLTQPQDKKNKKARKEES